VTGISPSQFVPVAVVSRSGVDESAHFGAVVCLGRNGDIEFSLGDPHTQIFPRSSTKPLQALAMVRSGLSLPAEKLALVCSSHNGEAIHQQTALAILAEFGLDESALGNTHAYPMLTESAHEAIRAGLPTSALQMGCSGKHSGMVATCVINGWPLGNYLEQDHPLQQAITRTVAEVTGHDAFAIGIDGCGAPAHVVKLVGLARAMSAMATGAAGESGTQIYNAMSQFPYMVGGKGRDVTTIVSGIDGLFAKDGADAVYAAALPDGRAVALKMSDGFGRGSQTVLLAALQKLGVDISHVHNSIVETVYGHGKPVGSVRAIGFD
jgi:L-asparaginase II